MRRSSLIALAASLAGVGAVAAGVVIETTAPSTTPVVRAAVSPGEAFAGLTPTSHPPTSAPTSTSTSSSPTPDPVDLATPKRLSLPAIGQHDVPIVMPVGVIGGTATQGSGPDDERGLLSAPADAQQLGWYRYCYSEALPSRKCVDYRGPLVIDGHVGVSNTGALADVWRLHAGDKAFLTDSTGRTLTFTAVGKPIAFAKHTMAEVGLWNADHNGQLLVLTCYSKSRWVNGHHTENVGMLFTLDR